MGRAGRWIVIFSAFGTWAACGSSDGVADQAPDDTPNPVANSAPSQRGGAPAAWMASQEAMVIFGGMDPITNDTFAFREADTAWQELSPQTQGAVPQSRCHHTLTAIPDADQAILFGGFSRRGRFNDTWRFDLASETWTELATGGDTPAARCLHASAFVPSRNQLVVFGGIAGGGRLATDFFGDTHLLDVETGTWSQVEGDGPSPREGSLMVYSLEEDAVFLWGGKAFDRYPADLWRFDLTSHEWAIVTTTGEVPPGREDPTFFWDDERGRLTVFSGRNDTLGVPLLDDGFELDLATRTWSVINTDPTPPARWRASAAVDPAASMGYAFGGWRDFGGGEAFNDTWRYDLQARRWTELADE